MLKTLETWLAHRTRNRFMAEQGMSLQGYDGGLVIHHLMVSELGYLLRNVTDGRLERFDDFQTITQASPLILSAIQTEMEKPVLREQEAFKIDRESAQMNMQNLAKIVRCISDFVVLSRVLKLPLPSVPRYG